MKTLIDNNLYLYRDKVEDYLRDQKTLLKYLDLYIQLNTEIVSDEYIDELYDQYADDDEYCFLKHEKHGTKLDYLKYEMLRLIEIKKKSLLEDLECSFKRLDVLLNSIK